MFMEGDSENVHEPPEERPATDYGSVSIGGTFLLLAWRTNCRIEEVTNLLLGDAPSLLFLDDPGAKLPDAAIEGMNIIVCCKTDVNENYINVFPNPAQLHQRDFV